MDALVARLKGGDNSAFEQLVAALISQDNDTRKQAEDFYKQLLEHEPDVVVRYLAGGLAHQHVDMKSFCAVYLRKAVRTDGVWDGCTPTTKDMVKQQGIKCLTEERNKALMHKLADTVSEVAAQTWTTESERWLDVLKHMQSFIASGEPHLVEAALILFANLTEWLGQDDILQQQARRMYDVLLSCLQSPNKDVQVAACTASTNFIMSFEEDGEAILGLHGLVRGMVDAAGARLQAGDELEARDILIQMAELAEHEARLFKPDLKHYVAVLFQVANNGSFDSDTRSSALEVALCLVETRAALFRKDPAHVAMLCETCMVMLLDVEDVPEWHTAVEEQDLEAGQEELHEYALQALDRVAKPIGGKFLLPALWPLIQQWAQDQDWRKRHGALCAVAQVAEGCRKLLLPDAPLGSLMAVCCSAVNDPHPIVKWAACQAIGQVCTDLAPRVQKKHHGDMMKVLIHLMGPQEEPRVQAHAASAVVNFCESLDGNIVGLYLKALTERVIALLASPNQLVVEGALTATSSVADSSAELFKPYYDAVMPVLKQILTSAKGKAQRRLCGKAVECISLIAMNVGKEVFYKDARDFMGFLQQVHTTEMEPDDPMLTYVQSAGTRMCKCLGTDFVPLLPAFMPALLRSAGKKSELETLDAEDVDEDEDADEFSYYPIGDKVIRISTAHTEEKVNALNMLSCYAEDMKEHFAPYCAEVAGIVEHVVTVPLLNTEDMRRTCAGLIPSLLNCLQLARKAGTWPQATDATVREMYERLMKALLKGLGTELDPEVLHEMYDSMDQLVELADDGLVSAEDMAECFKRFDFEIGKLLEQRKARAGVQSSADYDEEDIEQLREDEEQDDEILQQVNSAIGAFLRRFGDAALPLVEELMGKYFNPMLTSPNATADDRWTALMVVSDVIEFAPASAKYLPQLMPTLLESAQSDNKELVNAAVYGLGVVAEKHPTVYAQHHQQILDMLCKLIAKLRGNEEWEHARDNTVAALGKVLCNHEHLTAGDVGAQLGKLWLECLPLYCDEVEAAKQHDTLLRLLQKNDPRILGENNSNLVKIAEVFVRVIAKGDEVLEADKAPGFTAFFVHQLRPVLEAQGFNLQQAVQMLEPKDQQRFEAALSGALGQ